MGNSTRYSSGFTNRPRTAVRLMSSNAGSSTRCCPWVGFCFKAFLKLVGPGDFGKTVKLDNGRIVQRSENQHSRRLLTVFGEFIVSRWAYAQREKAKFEFIPTDQRLQLPDSEVSYLLQEWDQLLGVEQAFGQVREVIKTILRISQIGRHTGKRQSADGRVRTGVSREPRICGSGHGRRIVGGHRR